MGALTNRSNRSSYSYSKHRGMALLGAVALLGVLALATLAMVEAWGQRERRERELLLLRVGEAYALALRAYHEATPGPDKRYPPSLDELLEDRRFVRPLRHLRQLYPDPTTNAPWGLEYAASGGIRAVYSTSTQRPLRTGPVTHRTLRLSAAQSYRDWMFGPDSLASTAQRKD